jgi:hypothetical protein
VKESKYPITPFLRIFLRVPDLLVASFPEQLGAWERHYEKVGGWRTDPGWFDVEDESEEAVSSDGALSGGDVNIWLEGNSYKGTCFFVELNNVPATSFVENPVTPTIGVWWQLAGISLNWAHFCHHPKCDDLWSRSAQREMLLTQTAIRNMDKAERRKQPPRSAGSPNQNSCSLSRPPPAAAGDIPIELEQ